MYGAWEGLGSISKRPSKKSKFKNRHPKKWRFEFCAPSGLGQQRLWYLLLVECTSHKRVQASNSGAGIWLFRTKFQGPSLNPEIKFRGQGQIPWPTTEFQIPTFRGKFQGVLGILGGRRGAASRIQSHQSSMQDFDVHDKIMLGGKGATPQERTWKRVANSTPGICHCVQATPISSDGIWPPENVFRPLAWTRYFSRFYISVIARQKKVKNEKSTLAYVKSKYQ